MAERAGAQMKAWIVPLIALLTVVVSVALFVGDTRSMASQGLRETAATAENVREHEQRLRSLEEDRAVARALLERIARDVELTRKAQERQVRK